MDDIFDVQTHALGPAGRLPLKPDFLRDAPSGHVFGWTQDVGMGWNPAQLRRPEVLILSTQGGIRLPDGTPLALGNLAGVPVFVAVVGLVLTVYLHVRGVKAALLISIIATTIIAVILNGLYGWKAFPTVGAAVIPASIVAAPASVSALNRARSWGRCATSSANR